MSLPRALEEKLSQTLGGQITTRSSVSGGCINQAALIEVGGQLLFVKWNTSAPRAFFKMEAAGLEALASTGAVRVPDAVAHSDRDGDCPAHLVLEFIPQAKAFDRTSFGAALGNSLAKLHTATKDSYGFAQDNFIGTLKQANSLTDSWPSFFGHQRLGAQARISARKGSLRPGQLKKIDRLIGRLPQLIPADPGASLLHGDLWSGNYMVAPGGEPVLVDPAVYYGHTEVELAFTELFGGFPTSFYTTYYAALPREAGARDRVSLYNCYPLLVHVNLFGGGYVRQLMEAVDIYI